MVPALDQPRLQLFLDDKKEVTGFGWRHESQFIYGQYNAEEINEHDTQGHLSLVLKNDSL